MQWQEEDCTIQYQGKSFKASGAVVTPERVYAYLGKKNNGQWVVTDWHGNVLAQAEILSIKPHRGWISNQRIYLHFSLDGTTYSGVGFGEELYLKARRIKGR